MQGLKPNVYIFETKEIFRKNGKNISERGIFMCTAVFLKGKSALFGRNLDLEYHFDEKIAVVPRNFPLLLRKLPVQKRHFSIIGTAHIEDEHPLFYDAMNEHGLCAAALNFPENAVYLPEKEGVPNVAPFEIIPFVLGSCSNLAEARKTLEHANILSTDFSKNLPATPLHWIFADKTGSITVEPMKNGLKIHDNPVGVLTNNPPFGFQMQNLENYLNLTACEPQNRFGRGIKLSPYSRGMGAMGLPGDFSSMSRFVRTAFAKINSVYEGDDVTQFFHILGYSEQISGCVRLPDCRLEKTVYSSCADLEKGIYYWRTYENSRIRAVDMMREDLEGERLVLYPMFSEQDFEFLN